MLNSIIGSSLNISTFLTCMAVAIILGFLTALVFRFRSHQTASFTLTISLLPMAVAVIIMLVNGNIGAGVAVAGAFGLVRFRSAAGSGREIAAIFIAMAIGMAIGMGYVYLAGIFFLLVALVTLGLTFAGLGGSAATTKLLRITLPENVDYNGLFDEVFAKYHVKTELVRIKTANMGTLFEIHYHVTFPDAQTPKGFIDELRTLNGNLTIAIGPVAEKESL